MARRRTGKAKSAEFARRAELPHSSRRIYLRMAPADIAFFKFNLEACDNLAYLSIVDKHAAVLQLVHAPGAGREVRQFLDSMRKAVAFEELTLDTHGDE